MPRDRIYSIWLNMRQRCSNPNASGYKNYGGRGITVCNQWNDYFVFQTWALSNGYAPHLTIERRDVDGNYEPSNCYWATYSTQIANKRKRVGTKHNFIGVRQLPGGRWQSIINVNKSKLISLGTYGCDHDAAQARDDYIKANNLPHKLNF